jgi:hypothetical protein
LKQNTETGGKAKHNNKIEKAKSSRGHFLPIYHMHALQGSADEQNIGMLRHINVMMIKRA